MPSSSPHVGPTSHPSKNHLLVKCRMTAYPDTERAESGMTQDAYCVSPEAKLYDVMVEMARHRYGCAVVVQSGKPVGVFTTTDALKFLAEGLDGE